MHVTKQCKPIWINSNHSNVCRNNF